MNEALNFYENEKSVISIHGYIYPMNISLPETFFIKDADCWGWATWKRGWVLFEHDGKRLLKQLHKRKLIKKFNMNGYFPFTKMLEDQIEGRNDSWAVRWRASAVLNDKFTLYPGVSLIRNIGNDGSGIHGGLLKVFDTKISNKSIVIKNIPVEENILILKEIGKFHKNIYGSLLNRIKNRIVRISTRMYSRYF
jgi:hypothetical protein